MNKYPTKDTDDEEVYRRQTVEEPPRFAIMVERYFWRIVLLIVMTIGVAVLVSCDENKPTTDKISVAAKAKIDSLQSIIDSLSVYVKPVKAKHSSGCDTLKAGDRLYVMYITEILPAVVVHNDKKNEMIEFKIRDYYDNTKWDNEHIWLQYGHKAIIRK